MIATRTCVAAFAALAAALMSTPALATGTPPAPTPTPAPQSTSTSTSGAAAVAGARGGDAAATGGNARQGQGQDQSAASSIKDFSSSTARSWSLFLPPPVWTPPMPRPEVPDLCPAPTETQSARSVGAGVLFSTADSLRDNDPCTAIKYSGILWDRCQYLKSSRALNLGLKLFAMKAGEPWDMADQPGLVDYAPKECAVLRTPAVSTQTVIHNYLAPEPAATPKELPKVQPKRKAAAAKKRSKFVDPCVTAQAKRCTKT